MRKPGMMFYRDPTARWDVTLTGNVPLLRGKVRKGVTTHAVRTAVQLSTPILALPPVVFGTNLAYLGKAPFLLPSPLTGEG
jgi:hypothetical protein